MIVLMIPGAALLDIQPVTGGVRVRCPGCEALHTYAVRAGERRSTAFQHEAGCPLYARMEDAIADSQAGGCRRGATGSRGRCMGG